MDKYDLSSPPEIKDPNDQVVLAQRRMFFERNCPPRFVLEAGGKQVEKHLEKCEHCREILKNKPKVLQFEHLEKNPKLKFGEVRRLVTFHNPGVLWDAHCNYLNPPLLFPLSPLKTGGFWVAIVFNEPLLALSNDIPIGNNYFVEMWNAIDVPRCFIGDEIYHKCNIPSSVFFDSKRELPEKYSPIFRFRQQEMMVSWAFQDLGMRDISSK